MIFIAGDIDKTAAIAVVPEHGISINRTKWKNWDRNNKTTIYLNRQKNQNKKQNIFLSSIMLFWTSNKGSHKTWLKENNMHKIRK